ncbi:bifunctional 4-hydroxy-2-oxoglutarate aldolase/2-dehydro-3-deoxy-phosphogluconate aldolase [Lewinella sp. IMCC34191]|uniref:bifunctional 4-hydroxy-2-oxoglutarate aldolase/2-dehydro-3-deoxy-phosphogluconate aldolase n=1 Tax=Lewinella sp. IMCC34191 TaxID=2259172 RepID=UPI000E2263BC|nr:bifunctional 4-hydroxy-2-oxoglutarate aldolase/2-dehydro-3-deoxy-phosphogluconate aldolase [Lewinella sp. IMCC34191]
MANTHPFSWESFNALPVIAILRGYDRKQCRRIAGVGMAAGFHTLEVTMNTAEAADIIRELRDLHPELNVGAGTVCTLEDYEVAVAAGAQFIVMPIVEEEVIVSAVAEDIPVFPGAFTPTEVYRAWSLGASAVKLFPAGQLGPSYVRDILSPLDDVRLLPTGGIDATNVQSYFEAGAYGVGMGSGLLDKPLIQANDYDGLKSHFEAVRRGFQPRSRTLSPTAR